MIIDRGHDLEVGAVIEQHATHDIHLPQLHRAVALPAAELVSSLLAPAQFDEVVTLQTPIDARATRQRIDTLFFELVQDPARSPPRMLPAQLADHRLELGRDLVHAAVGTMRPVGESGETACFVAGDPFVHRLTGTPRRSATSVTFQPSCTTAMTA